MNIATEMHFHGSEAARTLMRNSGRLLVSFVCALALCGAASAQMGASLVPPSSATCIATQSGSWQAAATWDGRIPQAGDRVYIPTGIIVTNHATTADVLWGRGGKLHLEYNRQLNVDGVTIVGDNGFRPAFNSISRLSEAVLLRSPEVTVKNWSIEHVSAHMAKFRVEGPNDPGGIAGKNLVIQGATVNADGSVTTN